MNPRRFKPGDVACVDSWRGRGLLAFRVTRDNSGIDWCVLQGTDTRGLRNDEIADAYPVLVLSPNYFTAVNIAQAVGDVVAHPGQDISHIVEAVEKHLRSLVPQPKPDEPTGLGAVVEDADGERWVRVNQRTGTQEWRCCDFNGEFRNWPAIDAVRVLSEGVPADLTTPGWEGSA